MIRNHLRLVLSPDTGRLERVFSLGVLAAAVSPSASANRTSADVVNVRGVGAGLPQRPTAAITLDEVYRRCAEEHLRSFNAARAANLPFAKAVAEANHCADVLRQELMTQWRAIQP